MVTLVTGGVFDVLHTNHKRWIDRCIQATSPQKIILLVHSNTRVVSTKGNTRPLFTFDWRKQDLQQYLDTLSIEYEIVQQTLPALDCLDVYLNKHDYIIVIRSTHSLTVSNVLHLPELPGIHTSDIPHTIKQLEQLSLRNNLKVGAVLVRAGEVIATGYNGTSNCDKCHNKLSKFCTVPHAEEQVLQDALPEDDLFIFYAPCIRCAVRIHQVGVRRVVYFKDFRFSEGIEFLKSRNVLLRKAGL
jgi:deoxycytidylate deaminase